MRDRKSGWASRKNKVKAEKHLETQAGFREDAGVARYLHGPLDFAKNAETAISCGRPGPAKKKERGTPVAGREEEVDTQVCPYGKAESRTKIVGECEKYNVERGELEDMRKINECDME